MNRIQIVIEVEHGVDDDTAELAMYCAVDRICRTYPSLTSEDYSFSYGVQRPDDYGFDPTPQT